MVTGIATVTVSQCMCSDRPRLRLFNGMHVRGIISMFRILNVINGHFLCYVTPINRFSVIVVDIQ